MRYLTGKFRVFCWLIALCSAIFAPVALWAAPWEVRVGVEQGESKNDLEGRFQEDALISDTNGTFSTTGELLSPFDQTGGTSYELALRYYQPWQQMRLFFGAALERRTGAYSYTGLSNAGAFGYSGNTVSMYELQEAIRRYQDLELGLRYPFAKAFGVQLRIGQRLFQERARMSQIGVATSTASTQASSLAMTSEEVSEYKGNARGNFLGLGFRYRLNDAWSLILERTRFGTLKGDFTQFGRPAQIGTITISTTPLTALFGNGQEFGSLYRVRIIEDSLRFQYKISERSMVDFGFVRETQVTSYPAYYQRFNLAIALLGSARTAGFAAITDSLSDAYVYGKENRVVSGRYNLSFLFRFGG